MRRLARWTFNGLTVLSLLLCAATVGVWARNGRTQEGITLRCGAWRTATAFQTNQFGVTAYRGHIGFTQRSLGFDLLYADDPASRHARPDDVAEYRRSAPAFLRVDYDGRFPQGGGYFDWHGLAWRTQVIWTKPEWDVIRTLIVPAWLVLLVSGLLPARWLWHRLHGRDDKRCPACSYNLTGNLSGVCPECGTAIVKGRHEASFPPDAEVPERAVVAAVCVDGGVVGAKRAPGGDAAASAAGAGQQIHKRYSRSDRQRRQA